MMVNTTLPFVSNVSMDCLGNGLHRISKKFISFRYSILELQTLTWEDDGGKNSMACTMECG
jgi:hypothetical protein